MSFLGDKLLCIQGSQGFTGQPEKRIKSAGAAPQDFVKLARWEVRGHYAQKQEAEKSQRQLHKMVRDSQEVLKRPAGGVIGAQSAALGFQDIVKYQQEQEGSGAAEQPPKKKAKVSIKQSWVWADKVCPQTAIGLPIGTLHSLYAPRTIEGASFHPGYGHSAWNKCLSTLVFLPCSRGTSFALAELKKDTLN